MVSRLLILLFAFDPPVTLPKEVRSGFEIVLAPYVDKRKDGVYNKSKNAAGQAHRNTQCKAQMGEVVNALLSWVCVKRVHVYLLPVCLFALLGRNPRLVFYAT
jgi:hypothetical protein